MRLANLPITFPGARLAKHALNRMGFDNIVFTGFSAVPINSFARILAGVDLVIDAGANIGQTHDLFRQSGYTGRIVSFEPEPGTFKKLIEREGHDWNRHGVALDKVNGSRKFFNGNGHRNGFYFPLDGEFRRDAIEVPCRRLDSYMFKERNIFVKVDCEGHDLAVVKGARGLFRRVSRVMMEVSLTRRFESDLPAEYVITEMSRLGFGLESVPRIYYTRPGYQQNSLDAVFVNRKFNQ